MRLNGRQCDSRLKERRPSKPPPDTPFLDSSNGPEWPSEKKWISSRCLGHNRVPPVPHRPPDTDTPRGCAWQLWASLTESPRLGQPLRDSHNAKSDSPTFLFKAPRRAKRVLHNASAIQRRELELSGGLKFHCSLNTASLSSSDHSPDQGHYVPSFLTVAKKYTTYWRIDAEKYIQQH